MGLTERLLDELRNATEPEAQKLMGTPGSRTTIGLHFMSNYRGRQGRTGDVNLTFKDGRVAIVESLLDPVGSEARPPEYLWNRDYPFSACSDFPGSRRRCNTENSR